MTAMVYRVMIDCRMAPPNLTEEQIIQREKADVVRHIAEHVAGQVVLEYDRRTNTVIGTWEVK